MIRVESLTKTYPGRRGAPGVKAVDGISFEVPEGQLVGLLGPNGAGKTTTVKMMCGLIKPDGGRISINGKDMINRRTEALREVSAVLEGNRNIYWRLTCRENLELFAALKGRDPRTLRSEISYYLEIFKLEEKANTEARKLSRGMQQKLATAVALLAGTNVVLLDEPTLGLDVQASYEIRELLKRIAAEQERTVLLTTHDMNVVQDTCQRVIIVNQGRIVADDSVDNLMNLFQAKVYRIVTGQLSPEQQQALAALPGVAVQPEQPDRWVISVRLEDSQVLYRIFSVLSEHNTEIHTIDQEQNNFERVFLEILERGARRAQQAGAV